MTPEAQRVAIAEACGWKHIRELGDPMKNRWVCFTDCPNGYPPESFTSETMVGLHPSNCEGARLSKLPDYLNDLNAMAEAEHRLEYQADAWCGEEGCGSAPEAYMNHIQDIVGNDDWMFMGASAAQRAEAFLKTIDKWTAS
jgi:hypothetical protein